MDGALSSPSRSMRRPRRRWAGFVVVIVAVALLHALATRSIADRMAAFDAAAQMPARLAVAYVRTIEPAAPPAAAPVAVAPAGMAAATARRPRSAAAPASAASASEPVPEVVARIEEPSSLVVEAMPATAAASEPATVTAAADSAIEAALPAASAASAPLAFEWPASTRVSYVLTGNYRGEVSGQARVEWVRKGSRYQVNYDFLVGPEFAPLISRRATSEGRIEVEGLVPERYDEETNVVFRERRRATVVFEAAEVVLADGQRKERIAGVQDTASQFIQLTWLFTTQPELLRAGATIEFPLALPRAMDRHAYEVVGEEMLDMPFGSVAAFHLKPLGAKKKNALAVEIWFAPSLRYLPVRIRVAQDESNYVDMLIDRKPEMAAS